MKFNYAMRSLQSKKIDPANYPETYKELEISLRRSLRRLRRLNNLTIDLAIGDQEQSLRLKDELDQLDRGLIRELFPD